MSTYFVTGSGTDIGKTFVTAGIVRAVRQSGRVVHALKPVMSGYAPANAAASDAGILLAALGQQVNEAKVAAISPWRYAAPISPDMAAAREGQAIEFDELLGFCRAASAGEGLVLIEGAGGVMAPLDDTHTMRDWAAALRLPALLVAGTYLGAISHTLSAAAALREAGVKIAMIVLSESAVSPVPPEETAAAVARFLPGIAVKIVPRGGLDAFDALAALL